MRVAVCALVLLCSVACGCCVFVFVCVVVVLVFVFGKRFCLLGGLGLRALRLLEWSLGVAWTGQCAAVLLWGCLLRWGFGRASGGWVFAGAWPSPEGVCSVGGGGLVLASAFLRF